MKKGTPANEELPLTENEFHQYIRSGQIDSFKSKINSAYVSTLRLTNVDSGSDCRTDGQCYRWPFTTDEWRSSTRSSNSTPRYSSSQRETRMERLPYTQRL